MRGHHNGREVHTCYNTEMISESYNFITKLNIPFEFECQVTCTCSRVKPAHKKNARHVVVVVVVEVVEVVVKVVHAKTDAQMFAQNKYRLSRD